MRYAIELMRGARNSYKAAADELMLPPAERHDERLLGALFAAHEKLPRSADLGGKRRVRRAAEDRDLTQLRIPGFPAGTAAGPGAP